MIALPPEDVAAAPLGDAEPLVAALDDVEADDVASAALPLPLLVAPALAALFVGDDAAAPDMMR